MIEALFGPGVVALLADESMESAPLLPEEAACLPRAVERRRREFAAGRACARAALLRLGLPEQPILRRADRSPRWPAGVVGSITHCPGLCGVAVARREERASLGLDAERCGRVGERLMARVCTAAERKRLRALEEGGAGTDWRTLVFSAKESVYKCWHPFTGVALGFHDVEIDLEPEQLRFTARLLHAQGGGRSLAGRYASDGRVVLTAVSLPPETAA